MPRTHAHPKLAAILIWALLGFGMLTTAQAEDSTPLPPIIQAQFKIPLQEMGSDTYSKFGFSIYRATLWARDGKWETTKPYALELCYRRSLSKETLVDTIAEDIHDQGVADDATLARWTKTLNDALSAVEDGDVLVGVSLPGNKALLFFNGKQILSIDDHVFSQAFFDIWLGDKADPDMRAKLVTASAKFDKPVFKKAAFYKPAP